MKLLWKRTQRLGQQSNAVALDRQLAGLGLEQQTLGTEDVAQIVVALEDGVGVLADQIALDEELDAPGHVLHMRKARLAHDAAAHQPAGDLHAQPECLDRLGLMLAVLGQQLARDHIAAKIIRKRRALGAQLRELLAPLRDQLVLLDHLLVRHGRRRLLIGLLTHRPAPVDPLPVKPLSAQDANVVASFSAPHANVCRRRSGLGI